MVTLVMMSVALPVLVSVMGAAELVVPTAWLPKLYDDGERATKGPGVRLNLVTRHRRVRPHMSAGSRLM